MDVNMNDFTYLFLDIETSGNHPHKNSMLALATVAYNSFGERIGDFYSNLVMLPNSVYSKSNLEFWNDNKDAHKAATIDPKPIMTVMSTFYSWLKNWGEYVFVGYNVAYDISFLSYYFDWTFGDDENRKVNLIPIELRSYMLGCLNLSWKETSKSNWNNLPFHSLLLEESEYGNIHHTALYDAELQAKVFWWLKNNKNV